MATEHSEQGFMKLYHYCAKCTWMESNQPSLCFRKND